MSEFQFEALGGHLVVNFINTLDERFSTVPTERLTDYAALLRFCFEAGLLDASVWARLAANSASAQADEVLMVARRFREDLFATLFAVLTHQEASREGVTRLNAAFARVAANRQLVFNDNRFSREWKEPDAVARPWWEIVLAAEDLLLGKDFSKLKKCAAADCGVLFVDESRGGIRRWCSMANCGNRQKVRQFRANHKTPVITVADQV